MRFNVFAFLTIYKSHKLDLFKLANQFIEQLMDSLEASKRFDLSKFCANLTKLDFISINDIVNREVVNSVGIKVKGKDALSCKNKYLNELKQLAFILGTGELPVGISEENIDLFKSVIAELVKKGNLKTSALRIFA